MTLKEKIARLEHDWKIGDPPVPSGTQYQELTDYLIKSQTSAINYYRIVFWIGVFGLILSLILFIVLVVNAEHWQVVFEIKEYPAAIASLVTMTFGHLEMESKKKELYQQLQKISHSFQDRTPDEKAIVEDYKKWSWSEFQDKFKPE